MGILCIGQLVADVLAYPVQDISFDIDTVCVDQININNGGDAMNTAMSIRYLGQEVEFAGRIGNDSFGKFLSDKMQSVGIVSHLIETEGVSTSSTIVLIREDGERIFLHNAGANQRLTPQDIDIAWMDGKKIVHIGGTYILPGIDGKGAAEIFRIAKEKGLLTSMDVTYNVSGNWLEKIRPCLPYLDYFLPSINEAKCITGFENPEDIADALLEKGVGNAVIKLGPEGCFFKNREESFYQPAYKADVVDTTGAGDTFVAGFLTGLLEELCHRDSAKLACAAGSVCVKQIGATTEKLNRKEVRAIAGV